jgi:hypothetical protein
MSQRGQPLATYVLDPLIGHVGSRSAIRFVVSACSICNVQIEPTILI